MAQRQLAFFRRLLASQRDDRADLLGRERRRSARARRIRQSLGHGRGFVGGAPAAQPMPHGLRPDAEPTRDLPNASSPRRQQDQLGAFGQFPRRAMGANQTGQRLLVSGGHDNGIGAKTWHWTSANQRTSSGFPMPFRSPIDSPSRAVPERYGLFFPGLWQSGLTLTDPESPFPACGTSPSPRP